MLCMCNIVKRIEHCFPNQQEVLRLNDNVVIIGYSFHSFVLSQFFSSQTICIKT